MEKEQKNLQFVPFSSIVNSAFWESFSKLKLNDLRLNTNPVKINGIYSRRSVEGLSPLLHLQHDSLGTASAQSGEVLAPGTLINVNTVEDFKRRDKAELLKIVSDEIWNAIITGDAEDNPRLLASFLIFLYADLKKYHYYYWFAFPVFSWPQSLQLISSPKTLLQRIADPQLIDVIQKLIFTSDADVSFFTLVFRDDSVQVLPLKEYYGSRMQSDKNHDVWLCFSDPSGFTEHPGWVLRNLLTLATARWQELKTHTVLALREKVTAKSWTIDGSLVFDVLIESDDLTSDKVPPSLGWEKNDRGNMGPKFTNMAKTMDPARIAETSVDLNLRLMKWRLDPVLNLEAMKNCRCLLIGAGTLGCNVARCLLGWGVQKITLVDNGRVSFSNPVRQSLFVFDDCLNEGKMKAEVAAEALKRIFPRVDATGVVLSVPMPGHSVSSNSFAQVTKDIATLERLVTEHDALFLLTDSRESRWLPSLLGATMKKIVMTAALGFDSYLVMRHGILSADIENLNDTVGCYFCNDVVAPGDSTSDRSLDQQCTVTRPGVSFMASGHIVEILVETLQHPYRLKDGGEVTTTPHSIRYYLGRMNQLVTTSPAFKNCSACSRMVLEAYLKGKSDFLLKVFNSPGYLEDVSGLTKLHQESETMELLELSDGEECE